MKQKVKILHLEDLRTDAELVERALKRGKIDSEIVVVSNKVNFIDALKTTSFDIVLTDHSLASFDSHEAIRLVKEANINIPVILVTATMSDEFAALVMKEGAHDYVLKDRLNRLPSAIIHAVEEQRFKEKHESERITSLRELQHKEIFNRGILNSLSSHIAVIDNTGKIVAVNDAWERFVTENGDDKLENTGVGGNYFKVFNKLAKPDQEVNKDILLGMKDVIDGKSTFHYLEYSCPSPIGERWFGMRITKFDNEVQMMVFSHQEITKRKLAEKELVITSNSLSQALNDLNKIMDSSIDIICTIDEEGRFANVSSASYPILGYTPEELIGKKYMDLVFAEDITKTAIVADNIMNGFPVTIFENRYIHKNGSLVPMLWSASWDINDKLMYCIAKDAGEKKKLEKALETERERFYDLFFQAPSCIGALKGPDHLYEMANPLYLQLIGKHDIIGKTVKEVLPEVVDQGFIDILDEVFETGNSFSANEKLVKLDHKGNGILGEFYLNILYQAHKDKDGVIEGVFFFTVDVTEQVLARKRIEKSESQYRNILETAQEGIWLFDENNKTTFVNEKMCAILEYPAHEIMGKSNLFFKDKEEQKVALKQLEKRKNGASEIHDATYITKSGKRIWTQVSGNPVFSDGGAYRGTLAMVTDISERKLAEEERGNLLNDLILRNNDLEQFAYIISHNLRGPVANIMGAADLMEDADISEQDKNKFSHGINQSAKKLDEVIKDLNHILTVKTKINQSTEKVNFEILVEDIKLSIPNLIENNDIEIIYDFEINDFLTLKGYMYSIFYNLISNSIKYRRNDVHTLIEITSRYIENKLELTFKDNGLGIDLVKRGEQVFGLYKRFHTGIEGKGMGLFMVKSQVETIGGKISVKSAVNEGSEFKIEFDYA